MAAADGEPPALPVGSGDEPRAAAYAILMRAAGRTLAAGPAARVLDELEEVNVEAERAHHPPAPTFCRASPCTAVKNQVAAVCDVRCCSRALFLYNPCTVSYTCPVTGSPTQLPLDSVYDRITASTLSGAISSAF